MYTSRQIIYIYVKITLMVAILLSCIYGATSRDSDVNRVLPESFVDWINTFFGWPQRKDNVCEDIKYKLTCLETDDIRTDCYPGLNCQEQKVRWMNYSSSRCEDFPVFQYIFLNDADLHKKDIEYTKEVYELCCKFSGNDRFACLFGHGFADRSIEFVSHGMFRAGWEWNYELRAQCKKYENWFQRNKCYYQLGIISRVLAIDEIRV